MLQGGYEGRQEFAAAPRVVNAHRKYKNPYGVDQEYVPQNIMHDKRVARGSTHAAMVIPGGTHPDTLLFERQKKMKRKQKVGWRSDTLTGRHGRARDASAPDHPHPGTSRRQT